jgi:hypothetical protein
MGIAATYPLLLRRNPPMFSSGCAVQKTVTLSAIAANPAVESKLRFGYNARPVYPVAGKQ